MKIAVFSAQEVAFSPAVDAEHFSLHQLEGADLKAWNAIMVIGSNRIDEETLLSRPVLDRLWKFVEQGGALYAELVAAFDFTSSRLFGWKQDFPKTNRTVEKLRVSGQCGGLQQGELLEWSGAMAMGFPIHAESILDFGIFKDTHVNRDEAAAVHPGLHIKKLGSGTVAYAAFALFSNGKLETLRPYYRWANVIDSLAVRTGIPFIEWPKVIDIVGTSNTPEQAVHRNVRWFHQSGMLPAADGSEGVYENIHSFNAELSLDRRPDCHAQTALMLYLYGQWSGNSDYLAVSDQLLRYLFDNNYQDLEEGSPSYGFFKWFDNPGDYPDQIFADDNSWVCFVLMYLYRKTNNETYLKHALPLAEALLSTQRDDGLREGMLLREQLAESGREGAAKLPASMNPHFESIAHAAFIQSYLVTGRRDYLDAALKGSKYLLDHMDELKFMYSRTSGLNRFLLPLGYLIQHDDSGQIERGMKQIIDYLLACQSELGGIEEMDNPDPERFGKEDAGVYIHNGEGIADQLYTNNFLLMNVWELWKATGNLEYRKLYDELSSYMCQIQIASTDVRYDGGWMRAFDLKNGEYFGNNGDTGWGPYCMESGWTNGIASTGLLLMLLDESVFE
jgi:hypothetical protein